MANFSPFPIRVCCVCVPMKGKARFVSAYRQTPNESTTRQVIVVEAQTG